MPGVLYPLEGVSLEMTRVSLEVVVPPFWEAGVGCRTCRTFMEQAGLATQSGREEYPEELLSMARNLSHWLDGIQANYPQVLKVELVDGLSPLGIWKQLRHRLRPLPGFILNGVRVCCGWDLGKAESLIRDRMRDLGFVCTNALFLS